MTNCFEIAAPVPSQHNQQRAIIGGCTHVNRARHAKNEVGTRPTQRPVKRKYFWYLYWSSIFVFKKVCRWEHSEGVKKYRSESCKNTGHIWTCDKLRLAGLEKYFDVSSTTGGF